jgi:hypothetical protein
MNDPHVETLTYGCATSPALRLDDVADFEHLLPRSGATANYSKKTIVIRLAEHFSATDEAVRSLQQDLDGWEIAIRLRFRDPGFRFVFRDSQIVDRAPTPPPPGGHTMITGTGRVVLGGVSASGRVETYFQPKELPPPTREVGASDLVRGLTSRYLDAWRGRELPTSIGYFVATSLKVAHNDGTGRNSAIEKALRVDPTVLNKFWQLLHTGDALQQRKADIPIQNRRTLNDREIQWIWKVTETLILRQAAQESPTVADLPVLTVDDIERAIDGG